MFSRLTLTDREEQGAAIWCTTVTSSVGVMEGCRAERQWRAALFVCLWMITAISVEVTASPLVAVS